MTPPSEPSTRRPGEPLPWCRGEAGRSSPVTWRPATSSRTIDVLVEPVDDETLTMLNIYASSFLFRDDAHYLNK